MAPVAPLGRDRAITYVTTGQLPVYLGSPHPTVMILEQDGRYRIRELVIDPAEAKAKGEAARAAGEPWMPEHLYALGKPTGEIFVEAATRDELVAKMKRLTWPATW